jgi:lipopolysaccharide export system protein LptA
MRSLRWLLLVAFFAIAASVFGIYRAKRMEQRANQRPTPASVPLDTRADAWNWEWGQSANGQPSYKMAAKKYRLSSDNNKAYLQDLELWIFMKDGAHYDRIRSPVAEFTIDSHKLYTPGEAEITLDVPVDGDPPRPLTSIKAAGIDFDSQTGQAVTSKPVAFTFEGGTGASTGAAYNPQTHALHLEHNVTLNLRGADPQSTPMKVEAGDLTYSETEGVVHLAPWSRLTRDETVINAMASVIRLKDKKLDTVDTVDAKGMDRRPGRELEYSAGALHVQYNDLGLMEKLHGVGNAKLVSHGNGSDTTMTGDTVDLLFDTSNGDSELASAAAKGNAAIESKPVPDPKGLTGDAKILRSDALDLHMRPGGKDLDRVNTHAPGTLEFIPNQIARHRRVLKASQMDIAYGAKNEIQSFHAVNATTETQPSEDDRNRKKPGPAVAYTSSKLMDATFDDKGQLKFMKQTGDFHYTEGARKAQADLATLEQENNVMNLESHARIADDTGSTAGDHIELQQATGDFDARGHVSTTRLPEETRKGEKKTGSDILDDQEPTQGLADRVTSGSRNHLIHYAGNAVLWQASNRIQADRIDIDRDKKTLVADGQVTSQFQDGDKNSDNDKSDDKDADEKKTKPAAAQPIFTIVKAQRMVYTDQDRQAIYTGGANFWRPTLTVKCDTLRAFLNDNKSDQDSRINHAFADGKVDILDISPGRQRIGNSEHAEYYSDEGKIILTGGAPQLHDTVRGDSTGEKLTYFTADNKLVIGGTPQKQVKTHLKKKKT